MTRAVTRVREARFVAEIDVDRMFSNISGTVANIEDVTAAPEPSTLSLMVLGGLALLLRRRDYAPTAAGLTGGSIPNRCRLR